jgi:hypothetical protein
VAATQEAFYHRLKINDAVRFGGSS